MGLLAATPLTFTFIQSALFTNCLGKLGRLVIEVMLRFNTAAQNSSNTLFALVPQLHLYTSLLGWLQVIAVLLSVLERYYSTVIVFISLTILLGFAGTKILLEINAPIKVSLSILCCVYITNSCCLWKVTKETITLCTNELHALVVS